MRGFNLAGVFCLWMTFITGIKIELIPPHPLLNQSVLLHVTHIDGSIRTFSWFRGELARSQYQILSYNKRDNPPESPGPLYFPRVSSFPNASLKISDLHTGDQDNYTVQVSMNDGQDRSTVQLHVYELVIKPFIKASATYAIRDETFRLECGTIHSVKIQWGRTGKPFPPGVIRSPDNRTITFPNVRPSDAGNYWCEAQNPINKMTSEIYTLSVYCICGSTSDLSAGDISGIIIGTILGLALLAGGFLLILFFQRHKHPAREETGEEEIKQDYPVEYYNVQATTVVRNQKLTNVHLVASSLIVTIVVITKSSYSCLF
ncbi:carcinoembryonic antigen-related cell adhesion molecule 7-like [Ranitomeya imitator]|uniref:carcinoembryonic antigen-related cell adhesion molecule 7-like n=1 Tax=Ranitomeya imitator TaxID=111125 RepID=UPI0037E7C473